MTTSTTSGATADLQDLLGYRLAHRAMVRDVSRLAARAAELTEFKASLRPDEARPLATYLELLADSVAHHHRVEDTVLWPVFPTAAGEQLAELTQEHAELDRMLGGLLGAAERLEASAAAVRELAAGLAALRDRLAEHVGRKEALLLPLATAHVGRAEWLAAEQALRKGTRPGFEQPRALDVATPDERPQVETAARLLHPFAHRPYRKLERAVFPS